LTVEPEPLSAQKLGNESETAPPEQPQVWTPRFILIFALVALSGGAATLLGVSGSPLGNSPYNVLLSANQASLILRGGLTVVCLIGLRAVSSKPLRAGFLLRAVVEISAIVSSLTLLGLVRSPLLLALSDLLFLSPWFLSLMNALAVISQLRLSYGLARWQPSDNVFIWLQVLLTLGPGVVILWSASIPPISDTAFLLWVVTGPFLEIAGIACLLFRPACWKASPLIVLCLTAGATASLLFGNVLSRLFSPPASAAHMLQVSSGIGLVGATLFVLGLLLLIQRARPQQKGSLQN
jgi:hypothetical protein